MPVMVIGADTPTGTLITERLLDPEREVRVFVTDTDAAAAWRRRGAKVALGDVSDDSHVEGACLGVFSVVLVCQAAEDDRERSFARDRGQVLSGWARAARAAGARRVIWVTASAPPSVPDVEVARVDPGVADMAEQVFRLDDAARLAT